MAEETRKKNEKQNKIPPLELLADIRKLKTKNNWEKIIEYVDFLPSPLNLEWIDVADEVAFALGHLGETDEAACLYEETFKIEPTARRAGALAYLYYDALLQASGPGGNKGKAKNRDKEGDREKFLFWVEKALKLNPHSIKDMYRLGVYEAQVQSKHDKTALRWFRKAIDAFRSMKPEKRTARDDLFKTYIKSLYGAGRSALRLKRTEEARRYIFSCIREDKETDHYAPVFKLFTAGKVCTELGMLEDAERAFRLALDAKGPPNRRFIHVALAKLFLRAGCPKKAKAWLNQNIPAHKRAAWIWRLLGDIELELEHNEEARKAYENASKKDRSGKHITCCRLANLHMIEGRFGKAKKLYKEADKFYKRKYLSHYKEALIGLLAIARQNGNEQYVEELETTLEEMNGQDIRQRPERSADQGIE